MKERNTLSLEGKNVTIFIRRAFDWHGGSGIELIWEEEVTVFADTFRKAQADIQPYLPASAEVIFHIVKPMEKEEFTQINEALDEWKKELL